MMLLRRLAHRPLTASVQRRCKSYVLKYLRGQLPQDLKDLSGSIGCLYGPLPDVDEYGQFVLSPEVMAGYRQMGFVKLPRTVLDPNQVDILADEADELANNVEHHPKSENLYSTSLANLTSGPLFYCQGQWRAAWGMHDLVYHPSLAVAACQAMGNSLVRLWYDEVYIKAPRNGPCIPWQQNYARWQHTTPVSHVTLLIALDTLNRDRSAPCLIPGSHRWRGSDNLMPAVPYDPSQSEAQQLNTIWAVSTEEEHEVLMDTPPVTVDMRRGEALLIHPLTVFATHGNRSLNAARTCVVHYISDKTCAAHDGPLLPRSTSFKAGATVQGPYFPVVLDPSLTEDVTLLGPGKATVG